MSYVKTEILRKLWLFFAAIFVFSFGVQAQNASPADSLEASLHYYRALYPFSYFLDKTYIDLLNETADLLTDTDHLKAEFYADRALALSLLIDYENGKAAAYHAKGQVIFERHFFSQALEYYLQSLELYESIDNKKGEGAVCNSVGVVMLGQKNYEKAIEYFNKSLEIYQQLGNQKEVAGRLNNIGMVYHRQKKYGNALEYFYRAIEINKRINNDKWLALNYSNTGQVYKDLDIPVCLEYFEKQRLLHEKTNDTVGIAIALQRMGDFYVQRSNFKQGLDSLKRSYELAQKKNNLEVKLLSAASLSNAYAAVDSFEKAYRLHLEYKLLNDSLFSLNSNRQIVQLELQYRVEKEREAEASSIRSQISSQQSEVKQLKNLSKGLMISILLVIVSLALIYRNYYIKHKSIELLKKQKEDIHLQKMVLEQQNDEIEQQSSELQKANLLIKKQNEKIRYQKDELEQSLINLQILSIIGQEITTKLTLDEIIATAYMHINSMLDATVFAIGVIRSNNEIEFRGAMEDGIRKNNFMQNMDDESYFSTWILKYQKPIFIADIEVDSIYFAPHKQFLKTDKPTHSIIFLPLISHSETTGVLTVQSYDKNAYTENDLNLLKNLSVYIAIAIQNARFYSKLYKQKDLIELKNKKITESINYASRIQKALLPETTDLHKYFDDSFVFFKPKDIVSGDFYWLRKITTRNNANIKSYTLLAVADCTGHGVPGAFMSILGINFLNEISTEIIKKQETNIVASSVLNNLREKFKNTIQLSENQEAAKEGIDIALCVFDNETLELQFAGAYHPLYLIKRTGWYKKVSNPVCILLADKDGKTMLQIKANRNPIGGHWREKPFTNHKIQLEKGDLIYLASDGYKDQFGGEKQALFRSSNFQNLLFQNHLLPMKEQKSQLEITLKNWMSAENTAHIECSQIDDILVVGVKI